LPRALVRGEGGGTRLVAIDAHARNLGARVGMTAAEARARIPAIATAIVDDARIAALECIIIDALLTISPRLGCGWSASGPHAAHPASPREGAHDETGGFEDHVFFVEVASRDDVERLVTVVHDLDLGPATIGIADGAFAAVCAARIVEPRAPNPRKKLVPRSDDARFLAPLSSALLPASPLARDALVSLGLHSLALVAALPLEGVQARLGEEGRRLVALARGVAIPAVATYIPSDEPASEVDLVVGDSSNEGATSLDAVLFGLRAACMRLVPPLAARGEGLGEVELFLEGRGGSSTRVLVRPARPEIDPQALFELARATIEGNLSLSHRAAVGDRGGQAFVRLRLTATSLVPIEHSGEKLAFARREASVLPLDVVLARLRGRFGTGQVVTPIRHEDPRPDGRGIFRPATTTNVHERLHAEDQVAMLPRIELRERLRAPSPAIGAVILSRAPIPGDPWPVRAIGGGRENGARPSLIGRPTSATARSPRVVADVGPPEHVVSGWWDEPYQLVYRWVVANDGARALFARAAEQGGWRLVGVAD
jgi:nucleotidyltransferase/DNA polymerase involved in DNA repair